MMAAPDFDFFWDNELDLPQVNIGNGPELLGEFLQSELQGDIAACDRLTEQFNKSDSFRITGNMSSLLLKGNTVLLEPLFDDNILSVSMDKTDFLSMVCRWKTFLETR